MFNTKENADINYREIRDWSAHPLTKAILNIADALVLVMDAKGTILHWNARCESISGFSSDEVIGHKPWEFVIPPEAVEPTIAFFRTMTAGNYPLRRENAWIDRNGDRHIILWSNNVFARADGTVEIVIATGVDITQRIAAERALQDSETRFRDLVENTSDWAWEVDAQGVYTYASPKLDSLLGYTPDEVIGKTPFDLMDGDEAKKNAATFLNNAGHKRTFDGLLNVYRHKGGHTVILETSGVPILDDAGELLGYRGIDRDVTERVQSEQILHNLMHGTSNATGDVFFCNLVEHLAKSLDVACAMISEEPSNARPNPRTIAVWVEGEFVENREYISLDRNDGLDAPDTDLCMCPEHVRHCLVQSNGLSHLQIASCASVLLRSSAGMPLGRLTIMDTKQMKNLRTVRTMLNIFSARAGSELEREQAVVALRDSEERFRDFAKASADWLWESDEEHRFSYISDHGIVHASSGLRSHDIIGKKRTDFAKDDMTRYPEKWKRHVADMDAHRPIKDFRYHIATPKGGEREFSISSNPTFDADGTFKGYRGVASDITERLRAESELRRHRDHLEEMVAQRTAEVGEKAKELEQALQQEKEFNALQQKFVSLVSHEFRTPLAIIDGASQRLLRHKDNLGAHEVETRVGQIRASIARMIDQMETTLFASRLDEGKVEMETKPCNIGGLLSEVCNRQSEISPSHPIQIAADDLPHEVVADAKMMDHVFSNLLSNAVKFSPASSPVEVKSWRDGDNVLVSVTDHGVGISADDLPRMFERFFRAETALGFKGTGVGLSVVKEFVEMHGGSISVDSTEGQGATFTVRLPIGGRDQ